MSEPAVVRPRPATDDEDEDYTHTLFNSDGHLEEVFEVGYGPLRCRIPEATGKGLTQLASQVFSSGLVMAEMIELVRISVKGKRVLEIGSSTSLPSLLASTMAEPPESVLTTDYPDEKLIKNLEENVKRNEGSARCPVKAMGYKWGDDPKDILSTLPDPSAKFDLILSADNLWLHDEHTNLLTTISQSLSNTGDASVYFTTGHYAKRPVVDEFFTRLEGMGFAYEEIKFESVWEGEMEVDLGPGREKKDLDDRKQAVWAFRAWRP